VLRSLTAVAKLLRNELMHRYAKDKLLEFLQYLDGNGSQVGNRRRQSGIRVHTIGNLAMNRARITGIIAEVALIHSWQPRMTLSRVHSPGPRTGRVQALHRTPGGQGRMSGAGTWLSIEGAGQTVRRRCLPRPSGSVGRFRRESRRRRAGPFSLDHVFLLR